MYSKYFDEFKMERANPTSIVTAFTEILTMVEKSFPNFLSLCMNSSQSKLYVR